MATHLVALVSGSGWHVRDLLRAAAVLGVTLDTVPFPRVTSWVGIEPVRIEADNIDLGRVDGVLVRMMPPGSLEQVIFRMDALHRLEALGVPVWNPPRAVEAAVDKYLALAKLAAAGLPVPSTWVGESAAEALRAFDRLGGDVVLKPLFGAEGRGLMRVSDRELARRAFRTLERMNCILYVQEYKKNLGYDLRAFVLGDQVLGVMRRHVPPGDWRANVAVGGRAEAISLDLEVERLAIKAARAVGAVIAGVDLLPTNDGDLCVLEVNAVPGWRAFSAATGIDVASVVLEALRDRSS
jgi:ribosomal protein S6--L-glutamate ligase